MCSKSLQMQSLGADEAVNYREQDITEVFKDPSQHFDVVVDLVGGQAQITSLYCHKSYITLSSLTKATSPSPPSLYHVPLPTSLEDFWVAMS